MRSDDRLERAQAYLETLCSMRPHRRTGSPGNREATDFFVGIMRHLGYDVDATPFDSVDFVCNGAYLTYGTDSFEVYASPYSLACDVSAELVAVSTVGDLEKADCEGKILLMRDEICSEQLAPKNFVFYNPEHHQRIVALLESKKPAGIITATAQSPEQVGALYPFPLIVDGDFDIPSVYCRDTVGDELAVIQDSVCRLRIDAKRVPSSAANVIARLGKGAAEKIVITAHIDAYGDTPGATDNASGVAILLLAAEMLSDYRGKRGIEMAALNGEDHYSAGGQMDYLARYGGEVSSVLLAVNADGVGYRNGRSAYSFYGCSPELESKAQGVFGRFDGLVQGEQWFSGDHMIFVMSEAPSIAFTSECTAELLRTVTHTPADTPDIVDCRKLVEVAAALNELVRAM